MLKYRLNTLLQSKPEMYSTDVGTKSTHENVGRACVSRLARAEPFCKWCNVLLTVSDESFQNCPTHASVPVAKRSEMCLSVGRRHRRLQQITITTGFFFGSVERSA